MDRSFPGVWFLWWFDSMRALFLPDTFSCFLGENVAWVTVGPNMTPALQSCSVSVGEFKLPVAVFIYKHKRARAHTHTLSLAYILRAVKHGGQPRFSQHCCGPPTVE
jgi:hypothetical protein